MDIPQDNPLHQNWSAALCHTKLEHLRYCTASLSLDLGFAWPLFFSLQSRERLSTQSQDSGWIYPTSKLVSNFIYR